MSGTERQTTTTVTDEESDALLDQVLGAATKNATADEARDLVRNLMEQALSGTVRFDRNLARTFKAAMEKIDSKLSEQLNAIMHDERFLKLEGSWRGLNYLVQNSETGASLKIKVMNAPKGELGRDFERASEFDQSTLFRGIYENEFGMAGGEPYGALIGDYEWTNHPQDVEILRQISQVSAGAFAPFISGVGSQMFGFDDWTDLPTTRDLEMRFQGLDYAKWRSFRDTDESRFVTLVMPRVLGRLPYGAATKPIDEFAYEEAPSDNAGNARAMQHSEYCWMNAAYVMGAQMTAAFAETGFCTAIRGAENGGKVTNLPLHTYLSDDGDLAGKCPTEVPISDRREAELSKLGFLPLIHYKNTDYAVFMGAQTTNKPKVYDQPEANANAKISACLPYLMATGRFAHYLKVMARDKIGSFMEVSECETWLNRWIEQYVNGSDTASAEMKSRFPLREASVEVKAVPGSPGVYHAVAYLRPWLQLEELTASMRLVAEIPERRG